MKKVFLIVAILFANSVFTSCTDVDENLDNESVNSDVLATDGEDGQDYELFDDEEDN